MVGEELKQQSNKRLEKRPSIEIIFVTSSQPSAFSDIAKLLSAPDMSCLFHRSLIKRLFVFFSLRMLSFMRRRLSGAKIQDDAFDT